MIGNLLWGERGWPVIRRARRSELSRCLGHLRDGLSFG